MDPKKDYYKILGVDSSAGPDAVKKRFRKLAKEHHPDKGGDEKKFKDINEAYEVLGNTEKKAKYDNYISGGTRGFDGGHFGSMNMDDIFAQFHGRGFGNMTQIKRGTNIDLRINIDLEELLSSSQKEVSYKRVGIDEQIKEQRLQVGIGPGILNNQSIIQRGLGNYPNNIPKGGRYKLVAGLYIMIFYKPHKDYIVQDQNLIYKLELTYSELIGGKEKVLIPLLGGGFASIDIPPETGPSHKFRIGGKGLYLSSSRRADLFVETKLRMPKEVSDEQMELLKKFEELENAKA